MNFRREVTIGHLLADIETASGIGGKVNPPLRPQEDVDALWEHLVAATSTGWSATMRAARRRRSSGTRRATSCGQVGFRRHRIPAPRSRGCGARARPAVAEGRGTDRVDSRTALRARHQGRDRRGLRRGPRTRRPGAILDGGRGGLGSAQEYTPLQGLEIGARVESTFLRGRQVYTDGKVIGDPEGRYLSRPTTR